MYIIWPTACGHPSKLLCSGVQCQVHKDMDLMSLVWRNSNGQQRALISSLLGIFEINWNADRWPCLLIQHHTWPRKCSFGWKLVTIPTDILQNIEERLCRRIDAVISPKWGEPNLLPMWWSCKARTHTKKQVQISYIF